MKSRLLYLLAVTLIGTAFAISGAEQTDAQPRKGKVLKEIKDKREINKVKAAQILKRTDRIMKKAWKSAKVKKDKGQMETLKKAIRHNRVAHRIYRANGIYTRAAAHSLKARQLARDVLKSNKEAIAGDDQNTAEEDAILSEENAADLNAEAAKEQIQDAEIEKAAEESI